MAQPEPNDPTTEIPLQSNVLKPKKAILKNYFRNIIDDPKEGIVRKCA